MTSTKRSVASIAAVVILSGCCDPDLLRQHPEALVSGYSDLKCVSSDGDNTTLDFSYRLPISVSSDAALANLQGQVERSGWLKGSRPRSTCFRVVAKRANYLLMACDHPDDDVPYAWLFQIDGRVVRATTGPAQFVLQWAGKQE